MKDIHLEKMKQWKYTKVEENGKKPYPSGWQKTPLTLNQIPEYGNIGLILGELSNGVMAIDFDGPSSWGWFEENIGCELPDTIMWASGKESRCQMAFNIPYEYWDFIRTKKIISKAAHLTNDGKPEQIEFRWNGGQSVLPPSIHPEIIQGFNYYWVRSPSECTIAEIPEKILNWLLLTINHNILYPSPAVIYDTPVTVKEIFELLEKIKQKYVSLAYDEWRNVTYSVASEIGPQQACLLMQTVWPEKEKGEYQSLFKGYNKSLSPKIGSLYFMAGTRQLINKNEF